MFTEAMRHGSGLLPSSHVLNCVLVLRQLVSDISDINSTLGSQ
jgi:hypothetical protein